MSDASVETVTRVTSRFGLTPTSIRKIGRGHINDTFYVDTGTGEYVLQRINRSVFTNPEAVMSNLLTVHRFLRGAIVPGPVDADDGRWLVDDESGVWRMLERVPGADPVAFPSGQAADRAGELLGLLHARLANLDPGELAITIPRFHDPRRRLDQLREVVRADPQGRVGETSEEIALALTGTDLVELAEDFTDRVPVRAAHNDAKLDNFLFRDGHAVAIVDLDTLMPGQWFWDVGDLIRSAASTAEEDSTALDQVSVDPGQYDSVLAGYRRGVSDAATPAELEAIDVAGALITYEQALRFLTDWLAGDPYFRISRVGHNLDRARNQLRLLASMPHSPL